MSKGPYYVGVDVGGQSIKGGVVDDAGGILSSVSVPTEADLGQDHGLEQMAATVRLAVQEAGLGPDAITAIGVATPGTMDIPAGVMLEPPNLRPWKNVPVRKYIHETFKRPTSFQNDANAAAYGEFWAGVGRDASSLVLFTLGTGIGCGIILNDFILEGEHSHGAEVGHTIVEMSNPRACTCGGMGHLEAYASATAVVKRTFEALAQDGGRSSLHAMVKQSDVEINAHDIFDAAEEGDALAQRIVEETAYYLAVGAVNMMHTINPNLVVFAGGMIAAGEPFLQRIRHHVKRLAFPVPAERTQIVYAKLGTEAGIVGAAGCARLLALGKRAY